MNNRIQPIFEGLILACLIVIAAATITMAQRQPHGPAKEPVYQYRHFTYAPDSKFELVPKDLASDALSEPARYALPDLLERLAPYHWEVIWSDGRSFLLRRPYAKTGDFRVTP